MVRHAWLVLLAAIACHPSAAPPPVFAARPPRQSTPTPPFATTARDGVVVRALFDRAEGVCGWQAYFHVEAIDLATGATRWKLPAPWSQVVAELPDGALVVTNEGHRVAGPLAAAIVDRATGRVRATCDAPVNAAGRYLAWYVGAGRLSVVAGEMQAPSGIEQPPPPPAPMFVLATRADGCDFTQVDSARDFGSSLPPANRDLTGGDVTVRDVRGETSADFLTPHTLVAERGGATLWRRALTAVPDIPCNLP